MAEDKNGFLLYKDLIHSVRKLPKEKAGELFMHILSYVNDENPETEDLLIELSFEPIKQALKRDLKKYEKTKERNRENANKRWGKSQNMPNDATACDRIPNDTNLCDSIPLDAKHADIDSDNGSVIDSGSDNDILLEKETKEEKLIKENLDSEFFPEDNFNKDLSDQKRKNSPAKKEKPEPPDIESFVDLAKEIYQNELKLDFSLYEFAVRAKYNSWNDAGWKDGHKKPIQAWKNKLRNVIPFLKPIYGQSNNFNSNNGPSNIRSGGNKVDGTSEILNGNFRYFEPS